VDDILTAAQIEEQFDSEWILVEDPQTDKASCGPLQQPKVAQMVSSARRLGRTRMIFRTSKQPGDATVRQPARFLSDCSFSTRSNTV